MTCTTARNVPTAIAHLQRPDYSGLRLRMRADVRQIPDTTDWRKLPEPTRTEHVIAYVRATGGDVVWADAMEALPALRAAKMVEWMADHMRSSEKNTPHGVVLINMLCAEVAERVAPDLERMWDETRMEMREAPE